MNETGKKLIRRQKSTHDVDDVVNNYYWVGHVASDGGFK